MIDIFFWNKKNSNTVPAADNNSEIFMYNEEMKAMIKP